ncbi:uncharacterized protein LOC117785778 [Drosophila innubila]|uniref:uncharacterized protein LOC117785778 n=1 Tax=Drosophila innubila TaxID=198719 RepID=UPI00148D5346|nr:uncharacterized protein LOC117785778 [Drosophila innubila]
MSFKKARLTTHFLQDSNLSIVPIGKRSINRCIKVVQGEHDGSEGSVLKELLLLDDAFRVYFKKWLSEQSLQRMAAEKLWKLSKDYSMQVDMNCAAPKYPSADIEAIVNKYQVHYQIILSSNSALSRDLTSLRRNLLAFRRESGKLDLSENSTFILGDTFHKPIKFFIDLAEELFSYFHCSYLKLDCGSRHLDPSDLAAVENYQKILAPCEEFEDYLTHNLGYCQCLRPSQPCPEMPKHSSFKPKDADDLMHRAKQKRCALRLAKMSATHDNEDVQEASSRDDSTVLNLEHELRMHQLSMRLALLRQSNGAINMGHERDLVEQMIYALSPSLMPDGYQAPRGFSSSTFNIQPRSHGMSHHDI